MNMMSNVHKKQPKPFPTSWGIEMRTRHRTHMLKDAVTLMFWVVLVGGTVLLAGLL